MQREYKVTEVVELWVDGVRTGTFTIGGLAAHAQRLYEESKSGEEKFKELFQRINKVLDVLLAEGPPTELSKKIIAILEGKE